MERNKWMLMRLRTLAKLEVDAMGAYRAAMDRVSEQPIRERLEAFRQEHERHAHAYNELIVRLGGDPVSMRPDLTGVVLKTITSVTAAMGTRAALLALLGNEELSNGTYGVMLRLDWPPDLQRLISECHADEHRHRAWLEETVNFPERPAPAESEQRQV
ncbi:MAG: ferritin-like domain-containing protein [Myxococcaceae bacterium]|nr:ferritin-like domain-containing protein [Myxococcaceae bacterium]